MKKSKKKDFDYGKWPTLVLPAWEQALIDMITEARPPASEAEENLLAEIRRLREEGKEIEIPSNGTYPSS